MLGGVFGNTPNAKVYGGHGPLDIHVPAYIGLVWASVGLLALPVHLARYREDGVLRRLALGRAQAAVFGSQAIVVRDRAGRRRAGHRRRRAGVHIHAPRAPAGVLAAWLLAGSVFACLGILLSCIPTSRGALAPPGPVLRDDDAVRGRPSFEVMTGVMRHVSDILPLTYVTRILQAPWLGTALAWRDVAVALAIAVAAAVTARAAFRWE